MSSHVKEYLDYYKSRESTGYPVLVTGEWGVGKTYQVKKALSEKEMIYISLFGLRSISEVHAELLAAMYPRISSVKKVFDELGGTARDAGGIAALGGLFPSTLNSLLRQEVKNI